eukprot:684841-Pelagomonas_calceolata.AAC.5
MATRLLSQKVHTSVRGQHTIPKAIKASCRMRGKCQPALHLAQRPPSKGGSAGETPPPVSCGMWSMEQEQR